MDSLIASWTVTAGTYTESPIDKYTKAFLYTSSMHEDMRAHELFQGLSKRAHEFAHNLTDPSIIKWVNVKFTWY